MFKQKSDTAAPAADPVQQARTRARQRLVGAIVLLIVGVIGFPLVFETQPRPIPVDIPIEIPKRDAMPPLAQPSGPAGLAPMTATPAPLPETSKPPTVAAVPSRPSRSDEEIITESREDAGRELPPPKPAASAAERASSATSLARVGASAPARAPSVPTRVAAPSSPAPESRRVAAAPSAAAPARPAPSAAPRSDADGDRARALLEGRSPSTSPVAAEGSRFVVQVGAFADAAAARETRQKVEKLGLKTYTQVAQTADGSRIRVRVGPFASRADADVALAKAKAAGLTAVVLTL